MKKALKPFCFKAFFVVEATGLEAHSIYPISFILKGFLNMLPHILPHNHFSL